MRLNKKIDRKYCLFFALFAKTKQIESIFYSYNKTTTYLILFQLFQKRTNYILK